MNWDNLKGKPIKNLKKEEEKGKKERHSRQKAQHVRR